MKQKGNIILKAYMLVLLAGVYTCQLMAAQVDLIYTFKDKHEEKKAIKFEPDVNGVVTVIVKPIYGI